MVNIANDLLQQQAAFIDEECPHCEPNPDGEDRRANQDLYAERGHRGKRTHSPGT